jgi:predicted DNA-binding protein
MSRPRLYPSAPGEHVTGVVSAETREKVIELAQQSGTTQSAMVRELLERGLAARDEDED